MKVLAIETSCDETAAAILEKGTGGLSVLANVVSSSLKLQKEFGGVVPNLAAREHAKNIAPVVEEALKLVHLQPRDIDLLAVTQGPGLIPALLVGVTAAKTLAFVWKKPLLGIHHIEGHIYANLIGENQKSKIKNQNFAFPLLALVVSGGHTELVLMKDHFQYEISGETQDDAAGEAFDKVARMLGLPYPGGPEVARKADAFRTTHYSLPARNATHNVAGGPPTHSFQFPRPMIKSHDYNFSFSGLKTAVLYFLKKNEDKAKDEGFIAEVSHEFQEAIVDVLVSKTRKALEEYTPQTFVIAGGVSANIRLREQLQTLLHESFPQTQFLTPPFQYSLDNAAMIGAAALLRYEHLSAPQKESLFADTLTVEPDANLPLLKIKV